MKPKGYWLSMVSEKKPMGDITKIKRKVYNMTKEILYFPDPNYDKVYNMAKEILYFPDPNYDKDSIQFRSSVEYASWLSWAYHKKYHVVYIPPDKYRSPLWNKEDLFALLHELGHACIDNRNYKTGSMKSEIEAWKYAFRCVTVYNYLDIKLESLCCLKTYIIPSIETDCTYYRIICNLIRYLVFKYFGI